MSTQKLLLIAVVLLSGCGWMIEADNSPAPTPVVHADAADCLKVYGNRIADVFDKSADQFEQHVPSATVIKDMGDGLVPARIESFMPLMQKLNELRPASDDKKAEADIARASALREWAKQLRGVK